MCGGGEEGAFLNSCVRSSCPSVVVWLLLEEKVFECMVCVVCGDEREKRKQQLEIRWNSPRGVSKK